MRDRAFGVEIECGYSGPGIDRTADCTCECWCESERDYRRQYNSLYDASTEEQRQWKWCFSDEEISSFRCSLCRYGCEGCEGSYYDDEEGGCEVAATLLRDNGYSDWLDDIHPDGSGVEIPSPVLRGPQGLRELRNVMQLLSSNGFYTDTPDGLHVHHDAPEFDADRDLLAYTVELWEENFDHIQKFVAPRRRGTSWAGSRKEERKAQWDTFKQTKNLRDVPSWRTCALNITPITSPYRQHDPNIEIRLHEGTLDFRKAAAWIHFGQAFLWAAIRSYNKSREIRVCQEPMEVLRIANVRGNSRRALMEVAALA